MHTTVEHAYYAIVDTMHRVLVLYKLCILCIPGESHCQLQQKLASR